MDSKRDRHHPPQEETSEGIYEKVLKAGPFMPKNLEPDEAAAFGEAGRVLGHVQWLVENPLSWEQGSDKPEFSSERSAELLQAIANTPGRDLTRAEENTIMAVMGMHGITTDSHGVGNELGAFHMRDKHGMEAAIDAVSSSEPKSEYAVAFQAMPKEYVDKMKKDASERKEKLVDDLRTPEFLQSVRSAFAELLQTRATDPDRSESSEQLFEMGEAVEGEEKIERTSDALEIFVEVFYHRDSPLSLEKTIPGSVVQQLEKDYFLD